jgi:hypothetical protein
VYRIGKVHGWALAERKRSEIGLLPIEVVRFSDTLFWDAVRLKAAYPISYADAFATALAIAHGATLLTADPEFEVLGDRVMRVRCRPLSAPASASARKRIAVLGMRNRAYQSPFRPALGAYQWSDFKDSDPLNWSRREPGPNRTKRVPNRGQ